ncbi:Phosphopantetheine attachment site [Paenibacillus sp. 1_12]|uniref:acyl carrier protein n=1 Tax=Paenibacillus sp. 1_12 TaxID=1566278 RepID=UPI0008E22AB6|nr:acyl carrier protein [Paenibacillus sp. 1_12]SFL80355.1 Phosphopantetheine attachment site [Paenibacillus sp. 1_12]
MSQTILNKDSITDFVRNMVKEVLQTDEALTEDKELASLGMDSFNSMNLVIEFETRFEIVFDDEELLFENFATLRSMVDRICAKLGVDSLT